MTFEIIKLFFKIAADSRQHFKDLMMQQNWFAAGSTE